MKRLALCLALALPIQAQVPTSYAVNTGWAFKQDKRLHFGVGLAMSIPIYGLSSLIGNNDPIWDVLFWVTLAALVKENYDRHHGGRPDYADVAWTEAGAAVGIVLMRWNEKRLQKFAGIPPGALLNAPGPVGSLPQPISLGLPLAAPALTAPVPRP